VNAPNKILQRIRRFYFTMELYCTPKVDTLQLNTVGNSSNTRTHLTCTVMEHTPIEFFQQDLLWQFSNTPILAVRKLPNTPGQSVVGLSVRLHSTLAHSPSLACHLPALTIECLHRPPYKLTCSSRQSVVLRITSNLYSFSDRTRNFIRSP
jgi:hypothetical protein